MQKIIEKIIEPSRIEVGSIFKIKVKAIRYATYREVKDKQNYTNLKKFKYKNLKGE